MRSPFTAVRDRTVPIMLVYGFDRYAMQLPRPGLQIHCHNVSAEMAEKHLTQIIVEKMPVKDMDRWLKIEQSCDLD